MRYTRILITFFSIVSLFSCSCSNDEYQKDIDINKIHGTWIYDNTEYNLTNTPYFNDYYIMTNSGDKQEFMYQVYKWDDGRYLLFVHSVNGYYNATYLITKLDDVNCEIREFKGDKKKYKLKRK